MALSINQFGNTVTIRDNGKLLKQYPCNSSTEAKKVYKRLKEKYFGENKEVFKPV